MVGRDEYNKSIEALINYIKKNEKNPTEKVWNKIAVQKQYLSSLSIGYIGGCRFNLLCKDIRKKLIEEQRNNENS